MVAMTGISTSYPCLFSANYLVDEATSTAFLEEKKLPCIIGYDKWLRIGR